MKDANKVLGIVAVLITPLAYAGLYLAMLEPTGPAVYALNGDRPRYRWQALERFLAPAHWMDRKVRPDKWSPQRRFWISHAAPVEPQRDALHF